MPRFQSFILPLLSAAAALGLAGCGGGEDGNGTAAVAAVALTCDTKGYVAGSVEVPTAAQLGTYAGTYNGDEGTYGSKPGDPFVKNGAAALVLGTDGSVNYKGAAYTATSVCLEKASGSLGKILYIVAGKGHLDIADKVDATLGNAWGVSPADGTTIFTKGLKK